MNAVDPEGLKLAFITTCTRTGYNDENGDPVWVEKCETSVVWLPDPVVTNPIGPINIGGPGGPQNPGQTIGGAFTNDQQNQLTRVKEEVKDLLTNPICAGILGGKRKALALLNSAQIFSANTINPAYRGPGYSAAQASRTRALSSNNIVAMSEIPGHRVYLFNRFFEIDTSPMPPGGTRSVYSQATIFIHELHRNAGYKGPADSDSDRVEAACGTKPPYKK